MQRIVLISETNKRLKAKAKAMDFYRDGKFQMYLRYAKENLNVDKIFVLSIKYGLVPTDFEIEPYTETLKDKSLTEIRFWANEIIKQLRKESDLKNDLVFLFIKEEYRKYFINQIKNYEIPLQGLGIGQQMSLLKNIMEAS